MDICLMYGAVIAIAVAFLKRVPFVARNPKLIAAVLSTVAAFAPVMSGHVPTVETIQALIPCVLEQFGVAVATHETIFKPVKRLVA